MNILKLFVAVAFGLSLTSASAFAAPVTWTIPSTPMTPGGTVSGTFVYDASLPVDERLISINVTVPGTPDDNFRYAGRLRDVAITGQEFAVADASVVDHHTGISITVENIPSVAGGTYTVSSIMVGPCTATPDGKCSGVNNRGFANNVVITSSSPAAVPTLSEWAMIMLGALMAGGAALIINRRRHAS